jgi:hypothetical protein
VKATHLQESQPLHGLSADKVAIPIGNLLLSDCMAVRGIAQRVQQVGRGESMQMVVDAQGCIGCDDTSLSTLSRV